MLQFSDIPEFDRVLTAGDPPLVSLPAAELDRIAAIALGDSVFYVVSVDKAEYSPMWFLTVKRCKELGYRFLGHFTADAAILDLLRITGSEESEDEAAASVQDGQVLRNLVENSQGLEWFRKMVATCHALKASDIHLEIRESLTSVRVRLDGVMRMVMPVPTSLARDGLASAFTLLAEDRSRSEVAFNELMPQAAMIPLKLGEQRVNLRYQTHPVVGGIDATLRILRINSSESDAKLNVETLGYLPDQVKALNMAANSAAGGVFLAGVTGSGKTTTLNALLRAIAEEGLRKVITIEDPVEYIVKGVSHYSIQRGAGAPKDGERNPFLGAMMAFLRMDPDIGLFGEIRDAVSAQMAQAAIQTGHKILTTVHATSAISIVGRLCSSSIGLTRDGICSPGFISALAYQVLMPINCPHCKVPASQCMPPEDLAPYARLFGLDTSRIFVASDLGCEHCRVPGIDYRGSKRVGVKGVKVVAEVLLPDERILDLLLRGDDFGAKKYWRSKRCSHFSQPDMTGKEVWGHALYDISQGVLDPFYFEHTFGNPSLFSEAVADGVYPFNQPAGVPDTRDTRVANVDLRK